MSLPAPFERVGDHIGVALPGGRALFSTRHGGVSEGAFASLNLAASTPAPPSDDEGLAVATNREILAAEVGLPWSSFALGRQVHGAHVTTRARASGLGDGGEADGQLTAEHGVAVLVLVADCLPIVLAGPGAVGVLHGGWRGLHAGVIDSGVRALDAAGAGPLTAAIGPGAGACCYEVGDEVAEAFESVPGASQGAHLDLRTVARHLLRQAGVQDIHEVGLCTICDERFFSHRRDRGVTGRQGAVAWRS